MNEDKRVFDGIKCLKKCPYFSCGFCERYKQSMSFQPSADSYIVCSSCYDEIKELKKVTVKEIIEKLSSYNDDEEVQVLCLDGDYRKIQSIEKEDNKIIIYL